VTNDGQTTARQTTDHNSYLKLDRYVSTIVQKVVLGLDKYNKRNNEQNKKA